jgi:hypothetical protein
MIKNVKIMGKVAIMLFLSATLLTFVISCGSDDDSGPKNIKLTSLTAGDLDLNGAASPSNVPLDGAIVATFNVDVDEATATDANIKLVRDYDDAEIDLDIDTEENVVTITPTEALGSGSLYILSIDNLESEGGKLLASVERNFTTEGTFAPAGVIAHFTFEDNTNDVVAGYDPAASDVVDITFADSRKAAAGKAASFNGTTSLIEVPNADEFLEHNDFTLSFWTKPTFTADKAQFVMGLAGWYGFQFEIPGDWSWVKLASRYKQGDGTSDSEDAWFNGNGETKDNGGWQGWTFQKDVTASGDVGETYFKDKWAHVVVTYNSATKVNTMYINGEKVKEHDFNLWPNDSKKKTITGVTFAGNPTGNKLALGFIQGRENRIIADEWADPAITTNNHFKGLLDDVRIFSVPVTQTEVTLMYNSEKP